MTNEDYCVILERCKKSKKKNFIILVTCVSTKYKKLYFLKAFLVAGGLKYRHNITQRYTHMA